MCFPNVMNLNALLALSLVFQTLGAQAQMLLSDVDMSRIAERKVRNFIADRIQDSIQSLADLPRSVNEDPDLSSFTSHEKSYIVEASPQDAWNAYVSTDPAQAWNGKMMSFGLMYSKSSDELIYADGHFNGMEQGQICFIGFRFLGGLYRLSAAFEVTRVDSAYRIMEFTYMEGGKTSGRQQIRFYETAEGRTRIVHSTIYRSKSGFRDRRLYPYFHTKAIDEFHRNMR